MAEKIFTPEFGPNGAVLNAPGVTPERRQELETKNRLFPPGTSWQTRVKTLLLIPLAVAGMFGCAWLVDWLRSTYAITNREIWAAAFGFLSAFWVIAVFRRPGRWKQEIESQPDLRKPPLIWRLAVDVWYLSYLAVTLAVIAWALAVTLNAFESESGYVPYPLFAFVFLHNVLPFAVGRVRRKLEQRFGWVIP